MTSISRNADDVVVVLWNTVTVIARRLVDEHGRDGFHVAAFGARRCTDPSHFGDRTEMRQNRLLTLAVEKMLSALGDFGADHTLESERNLHRTLDRLVHVSDLSAFPWTCDECRRRDAIAKEATA